MWLTAANYATVAAALLVGTLPGAGRRFKVNGLYLYWLSSKIHMPFRNDPILGNESYFLRCILAWRVGYILGESVLILV